MYFLLEKTLSRMDETKGTTQEQQPTPPTVTKGKPAKNNQDSKSNLKQIGKLTLGVLGYGLMSGALAWAAKSVITDSSPDPDWKKAKAELATQGFYGAVSLEEDTSVVVLFRDIVFSVHPRDQDSLDWCGQAYQATDSLLKLEFTLRLDARVSPQMSDCDKAEQLATAAVFCLQKVRSTPAQKQYETLEFARERLTRTIYAHMHAVECLVNIG
jgi:hypothetical protein